MDFFNISSSLDLSRDVFIHPTNSSYGIGASIYNKEWYQKIYEMKNRNQNKPFFITVYDLQHISKVAIYDSRVEEYMCRYPEKTFTFILQRSPWLPKYVNPEFSTVGIQIASWHLKIVSELCWWYMFGTSANMSWEWAIYNQKEVEEHFVAWTDVMFLDAWDLEKNDPSTIIDLTKISAKIIRGSLD